MDLERNSRHFPGREAKTGDGRAWRGVRKKKDASYNQDLKRRKKHFHEKKGGLLG